jgi:hypothetical protein
MSVDFYPLNKAIRMTDLFDGRLEKHGVREHQTENATPMSRCLTDGENFVWAYGGDDDNHPVMFTRYAGNYPMLILDAIVAEFDVELGGVDDIDPRRPRLNPPLEWCCDSKSFYLVADSIDDDDCEKASGYSIKFVGPDAGFGVNFPEPTGRDTYFGCDTLTEAHEYLVECAIEDGALPESLRGAP